MDSSLWMRNLAAYSLQIAILVAAATLVQQILRIRMPALLLWGWQLLLVVCILLPLLQPWKKTVISARFTAAAGTRPEVTATALKTPTRSVLLPDSGTIVLILTTGVALRLAWLALGLLRLSAYRRRSSSLVDPPAAVEEMRGLVGRHPDMYVSTEISGPVTFGLGRGIILFPASFLEMEEKLQRPVACHELLHVRRRDWVFVVLEDVIRSIFWFHPAIWWAVEHIQLHREQVVDQEVVALTGDKKPYMESLLQIAGAWRRATAAPAPLFLKEGHLVQRVTVLVREVTMSRTQVIASVSAALALLLCTAGLAVGWFPLNAPPIVQQQDKQEAGSVAPPKREPIRVGANVQESKLLVKVHPVLPEKARQQRVSGMVMLQVVVNEDGEVYDVKVLKGHPLLDDAAVEAVRQWRYSPTLLNGEPVPVAATVNAIFARLSVTLDKAGNLRDEVTQLEGPDLIQAIKLSPGGVTINPSRDAPMPVIEDTVNYLQRNGILRLDVPGYALREGRLFATVGYGPEAGNMTPPSLALDNDRLAQIAQSSGANPTMQKPLLYQVFVNEVGEIVGLQQLRGPRIPPVESELMRTQVIRPGRRSGEPVPVVFLVEVAVPWLGPNQPAWRPKGGKSRSPLTRSPR